MWESRSDFQGAVARVENLGLVFQAFHGTDISTALFFADLCFCSGFIRFHFLLVDSSWPLPRGNSVYSVR